MSSNQISITPKLVRMSSMMWRTSYKDNNTSSMACSIIYTGQMSWQKEGISSGQRVLGP